MGLTNESVTFRFRAKSPRKRRGRWEITVEKCGSDGTRRHLTRMTEIRCDSSGRGSRLAQEQTERWVEELSEDERQRTQDLELSLAFAGLDAAKRNRLEMPLSEYGELFLSRRERAGSIEESTADDWRGDFKRYALSALPEGVRVFEITEDLVIDMLDELIHQRGLATSTARRGFLALQQVMSHAVLYDGLPENPCSRIQAPKKGIPRHNPLSVRAATNVIATLLNMRMTKTVFSACLALLTGISEGEICGLRRSRVDLRPVGGSFYIRECVGRKKGGFYLKGPKTGARVRRIQTTSQVQDLFARRISELERECKDKGMPMTREHFLIGKADGGYLTTTALSKSWQQLSSALDLRGIEGLPVTFHDLRHTFATCANAAGVDIESIAKIMGHSSTYVTQLVYISADPEEQLSCLLKLEDKLSMSAPHLNEVEYEDERRLEALRFFGSSQVA